MAKKQQTWRNRIVESGVLAASEFAANPGNWRVHPKPQAEALTGALNDLGWIQEVIVNRTTGLMLDGHLRVALALKQGKDTPVPVKYVELTEAEERLALATLDPIAAMAAADAQKLDELMQDINTGEAGLQAMLAGLAADNGLYQDAGNAGADTEPQIDRAEELRQKWGVEPGQLWQLGDHRIICGDCTDAATVARVMGGEKAEMMFTDPPYGVDYTGGHFHSGDVNIKRDRPKLANDGNADIYAKFLPVVLPFVNGPCYTWFADRGGKPVFDAIIGNGCEIHAMIIWNKTNATYAAMNAQYKQRHEPCMYFKPKGSTLRWVGASDECTVWDEKRDPSNNYHPTQKPIVLPTRAINNHDAGIVLDPFSGSGTTIIACENLSRRCRAIEIDAGYVAVALQRWATHTGKTPVLITQTPTP